MSEEGDKTAAQAMIDLLVDKWGVRHIFGLPGDGINSLMEALRVRQNDVQFVQVRHEEAAAFAAAGYAKWTGKLGVCISTTGPGATNMITGLYDATMDMVPVLAITGMAYHDTIGTFYMQDVATDRLMQDFAVYSERVMGPAHVETVTNLAVRAALGQRGLAHIGFPTDFQEEPMSAAKYSPMSQPHHTSTDWHAPRVAPVQVDLQRAARVLNEGKNVTILIGSGARDAGHEVLQVAEALGAPIAKAYLGKDVLPDDHPFVIGGVGPIGTKGGQDAMQGADTFLMIGTSFPFVSYLPDAETVRGVQIDTAPQRLGIRFPVEVGLVGDARETLRTLLPLIEPKGDKSFLEGIQRELEEVRRLEAERARSGDLPMKPQALSLALNERLADDAIICGDSGTNAFWISRDIRIRGTQRFSVSGLMASMGCALPYAIAAQIAFSDRQVVAIAGDGAFTMLMGELATFMKYKLPIKVIILKNNVLGMIRWEQMAYAGAPEYGVELQNIDFCKLAEAFGMRGIHLERPDDAADAVDQLLREPGPAVLEAVVDPFEPIIPGTGTIKPAQVEHLVEALQKGEVHAERVVREILRDADRNFAGNRDVLMKILQEQAPDLVERVRKHASEQTDDPTEVLEEQKAGAQERRSGQE